LFVTYDPYDPYEPAPPEPERWGLNLPLAIGVVTVFLIAVIAWVIIDATSADEGAVGPTVPPPDPAPASTLNTGSLVTPTTSTTPPLLPSTVPGGQPVPATVASTAAPAPVAPTAAPAPAPTAPPPAATVAATTAPPATGDTVPGDLGVANRPMTRPVCSGGYITVLASNVASQTSAAGIEQVLEQYPESEYLRTDQSCPSLDRSGEGEPIYVVYFGPFPEPTDACLARSEGPDGAYARQLSNDVGPDHAVNCD
jgi:cytoskeletal protein RodZ